MPCHSLPLPRAYPTWTCKRGVGCGSDLEAVRKDSAQMETVKYEIEENIQSWNAEHATNPLSLATLPNHLGSLRLSGQRDNCWPLDQDLPRSTPNLHSRLQLHQPCSCTPTSTPAVSLHFADCGCSSEGATTTALERRRFPCPDKRLVEQDTDTGVEATKGIEDTSRWEHAEKPSLATHVQPALCPTTIEIDDEEREKMTTLGTIPSIYTDYAYSDCFPFVNWNEETNETDFEDAVVFRSLVATVKSQPALDVSLEAKAVKFLELMGRNEEDSADVFLCSLASPSDESLTTFVQSIVVLISSASPAITTATVKMLGDMIVGCSANVRLDLVHADLIPQLINILDPQSLSIAEAVDIHINLIKSIRQSLWLASAFGLAELDIGDDDDKQAVHETVLQQVVVPSEKYICHLCVNRYTIIDHRLCESFLFLLARILRISPYYQTTMNILLHLPVFLTIPSCLTFFEDDYAISHTLYELVNAQREWNETRGGARQMWKIVHRMLRMEGIEDVTEERLRNDRNTNYGRWLIDNSID
ncbi:hypothetical protein BLNAU_20754 [Blattamonas nauphoetae]|uniref:Uncharacterized protein n=1 Tax=Blattamonas nauphoetae TaxID=2049346 RepID=A0ABQ9WXS9_9EUKA|nr:hypothetical protein BLNAU_20754 [Blattamonas nauphoetae]